MKDNENNLLLTVAEDAAIASFIFLDLSKVRDKSWWTNGYKKRGRTGI